MKRRDFITGAGVAAAWPIAARAQQAMPVIGFLGLETPTAFAERVRAFRQGLGEMGYVEGRNVAIVFQWAGGNYDVLPTLADELVRQRVSVLVAGGTTQVALSAKAARRDCTAASRWTSLLCWSRALLNPSSEYEV